MLYHPVSIGPLRLDGNLFLAPIAGYSDRAFRSLCVECGASFCTTEMVSAEALVRGSEKTAALMARAPQEKAYSVQLFGGDAEVMGRAARVVLERTDCDSIDINGGCPVQKIVKSGAGSVLTREPELLYAVVRAVKQAALAYSEEHPGRGAVPVTIKIRSGWDERRLTWREAAEAALAAGADALTIHARTRAQGYEGRADWQLQRRLVEFVAARIPVFGSGDARTPEDARRMLEETGVDGVMFARGAMGDPFLFRRTRQYLLEGRYEQESLRDRLLAGFTELERNVADKGERTACLQMRKKFCAYSSGIRGGARLRQSIVGANTVADYRSIFNSYLV